MPWPSIQWRRRWPERKELQSKWIQFQTRWDECGTAYVTRVGFHWRFYLNLLDAPRVNISLSSGAGPCRWLAESSGWATHGPRFPYGDQLWRSRALGCTGTVLRLLWGLHGVRWSLGRPRHVEKISYELDQVSDKKTVCEEVNKSDGVASEAYKCNVVVCFAFQLQCDEHNGENTRLQTVANEVGQLCSKRIARCSLQLDQKEGIVRKNSRHVCFMSTPLLSTPTVTCAAFTYMCCFWIFYCCDLLL